MAFVALFGIGSTNFHSTIGTPNGDFITDVSTEPTQAHRLETQLLERLEELQSIRPLDAVAISAPGLVDAKAGHIQKFDTPAGDLIEQIDLRTPIEDTFDLSVYLENDCTASALGEWYFGRREDHDCLLHLTFGTGIGGGVVDRGHPLRGESAQAGEFGLLSVAPESDLSSTGVTGAWEAFCSGRGIPQYVTHRLETDDEWSSDESAFTRTVAEDDELSAPAVFEAVHAGDQFAQSCLEQISRYNAAGIGTLCNAFNPGLVTLGGGVALNNEEWILEGIECHLAEFCFVDRPTLAFSPLGEEIGLYGALGTYRDRSGSQSAVEVPNPATSTSD
ncbi:ROK family protein [Natronosalvus rutilus]|uniref:ROK family protein n=1 Tax=Natronosalvus rutilus TaxID=2953753 RepID=A0A9E7NAI3_9EURY|nr:ROK family protein [Natronosalvus rutilus]UTF54794.1 ROK family protein [Natronosalvus rutilus]